MNKLTVQDVQKSFTDYVALVKKTCKTESEIQDLKRENEKLNKQLDAIEESRFSQKTPIKKEKGVEMTNKKTQWNSSTRIENQGPSPTQGTKIITKKGGRTRRRKNIKQYRIQTRRRRRERLIQ